MRHATVPVSAPAGPLDLRWARYYLLELINHDRAELGLSPVRLDDTASRAAQRHAEDMARHGFTSHWGTDGSVPEQRYTEAGGAHLVQENAACFSDGQRRELATEVRVLAEQLREVQRAFIDEVPPNDGHRRNIIKPQHNGVGIGVAQPAGFDQLCVAQGFIDQYGSYRPLPRRAKVGARVTIAGELEEPIAFGGIGIARLPPAKPLTAAELNTMSTYQIPSPYVLFFPPGFKTPVPVTVDGPRFTLDATLDDQQRPGRYEVSVWGRRPGSDDLIMVSLRTITVDE